jgi:anti-sigma factor RsiW
MTHPDELLSTFLDGELTAAERRKVLTHVAGCEECRAELEELAAVRARIRALPMLDVSSELLGLRPGRPTPSHRRRIWVGAAAAVAAAVVALATLTAPDATLSVTIGDLVTPLNARASLDQTFSPAKAPVVVELGGG